MTAEIVTFPQRDPDEHFPRTGRKIVQLMQRAGLEGENLQRAVRALVRALAPTEERER